MLMHAHATWVQLLAEAEEDAVLPGAAVTDSCEPPRMGTGH